MDNGVWVVATITLPGLPLGREAYVNPDDPYVAECLSHGYLQRSATRGDVSDEEPVGNGVDAAPVGEAITDG